MSNDELDLQWDGCLADGPPLTTIQLGGKWRAFLLGLVEILRQPGLWAKGVDYDLLEQQLDEIETRLMGEENPVMSLACSVICVPIPEMELEMVGEGGSFIDQGYRFHQHVYYSTPDNKTEPLAHHWVYLESGTYQVKTYFSRGPALGKWNIKFDDGVYAISSTFDAYYASNDYDHYQIFDVVISESREYKVSLWKQSKNPSSTGAQFVGTAIRFRRK